MGWAIILLLALAAAAAVWPVARRDKGGLPGRVCLVWGWAILLLLALATAAAWGPFAGGDQGALHFRAAALLLAFAGYALQGRPQLEGRPKPPPERRAVAESEFAAARE